MVLEAVECPLLPPHRSQVVKRWLPGSHFSLTREWGSQRKRDRGKERHRRLFWPRANGKHMCLQVRLNTGLIKSPSSDKPLFTSGVHTREVMIRHTCPWNQSEVNSRTQRWLIIARQTLFQKGFPFIVSDCETNRRLTSVYSFCVCVCVLVVGIDWIATTVHRDPGSCSPCFIFQSWFFTRDAWFGFVLFFPELEKSNVPFDASYWFKIKGPRWWNQIVRNRMKSYCNSHQAWIWP